jgi:hypothetical protein
MTATAPPPVSPLLLTPLLAKVLAMRDRCVSGPGRMDWVRGALTTGHGRSGAGLTPTAAEVTMAVASTSLGEASRGLSP